MSDGDLEGKCEETDRINVSGEIPILRPDDTREEALDESQPELYDSKVIHLRTPKPISEIQEHLYWKWVRIDIVRAIIDELQNTANIAEARGEVLEANVAREYQEKIKLQEALKAENHDKIEIFMRYLHRIYLHRLEESDRELAEEDLAKANEKIKMLENSELGSLFVKLGLSNEIEKQDALIKEYAKRFGTPESLWKLKEAEENRAMNGQKLPKYQTIEELITYYHTGKLPKTTGQRAMDFLEKIANPDTFYNIAQAVYRAFKKEKPKRLPIKINDCG